MTTGPDNANPAPPSGATAWLDATEIVPSQAGHPGLLGPLPLRCQDNLMRVGRVLGRVLGRLRDRLRRACGS